MEVRRYRSPNQSNHRFSRPDRDPDTVVTDDIVFGLIDSGRR